MQRKLKLVSKESYRPCVVLYRDIYCSLPFIPYGCRIMGGIKLLLLPKPLVFKAPKFWLDDTFVSH